MTHVVDVRALEVLVLREDHVKQAGDKCTVFLPSDGYCTLMTWSGFYRIHSKAFDMANPLLVHPY